MPHSESARSASSSSMDSTRSGDDGAARFVALAFLEAFAGCSGAAARSAERSAARKANGRRSSSLRFFHSAPIVWSLRERTTLKTARRATANLRDFAERKIRLLELELSAPLGAEGNLRKAACFSAAQTPGRRRQHAHKQ